jgi:Flp pilus assembly protein protease CpaA
LSVLVLRRVWLAAGVTHHFCSDQLGFRWGFAVFAGALRRFAANTPYISEISY